MKLFPLNSIRSSIVSLVIGITIASGCRSKSSQDDEVKMIAPAEAGPQVAEATKGAGAEDGKSDDRAMNLLFFGCHVTLMEVAGFKGTIKNAVTQGVLSGAKIEIFPSRYKSSGIVYSGSNGKYATVPAMTFCKIGDYAWVCASSPNLQSQCKKVSASLNPVYQIDLSLKPVTANLNKGRCNYDLEYSWQSTEGGCKKLEGLPVVFGAAAPASLDWTAATSYCNKLVESGYSDWRLPTRAELTGASSTTSSRYFRFPVTTAFWSSTEGVTSLRVPVAKSAYIENLTTPLTREATRLRLKTLKWPVVCVRN